MSKIVLICLILIGFSTSAFSFFGLFADFKPGECVKATDGFIWKVSRIEGSNYILQGWFNKWGNEVEMEFSVVSERAGHRKVGCPQYVVNQEQEASSCGKTAYNAWVETNGQPRDVNSKRKLAAFILEMCP
jgi:hypothetical protein